MGARLVAPLVCLGLIACLSSCSDDSKPTAPSTEVPIAPDAAGYREMVAWFAERGIVLPEEVPAVEAVAAAKPAARDDRILGDATGEGEVDGADLTLLWVYLTAFPFLTQHYDFDMLDIDRDGDNDWDDLYILGKHLYATPTPENTYRIGEPLTRPDEIAYNIDLVFVEGHGFSASQMALFEQAAERWEAIITDDLRDIDFTRNPWDSSKEDDWAGWWGEDLFGPIIVDDVVDDLRVFVASGDLDGSWGTGSAFWLRGGITNPDLPFLGLAAISNEVLASRYERNGVLLSVMLHELGHTLGFGKKVWEERNLLRNPSRDNPGADTYFSGWRARSAFNLAAHGLAYRGRRTPVENAGVENPGEGEMGANANDSHWRESVFGNEIMSSLADGWRSAPLSDITIRSMEDLGYEVDRSQADPYVIPPITAKPAIASTARPFCVVMPPPPIAIHEGW